MACGSFITYLTLCFRICKEDCPSSLYTTSEDDVSTKTNEGNYKVLVPLHICILLTLTAVIVLFGVEIGCEKCRRNLAMCICLLCANVVAVALGFALLFAYNDKGYFLIYVFSKDLDYSQYYEMFKIVTGCGVAFATASLSLAIVVVVFAAI